MARVGIDKERCKGCELCIPVCKPQVLVMTSEMNSRGFRLPVLTSQEGCTACMACVIICPDLAVQVYADSKRRPRVGVVSSSASRTSPGGGQ